MKNIFFYFLIFFNVYLFFGGQRETEHERGRGRERGRENPKQTLQDQHRAQCGAWTHEPWDHDLSQNQESMLNPLSHPGAPALFFFYAFYQMVACRVIRSFIHSFIHSFVIDHWNQPSVVSSAPAFLFFSFPTLHGNWDVSPDPDISGSNSLFWLLHPVTWASRKCGVRPLRTAPWIPCHSRKPRL